MYSLANPVWTYIPSLPFAPGPTTGVAHNGEIWVCGNRSDLISAYNPNNREHKLSPYSYHQTGLDV